MKITQRTQRFRPVALIALIIMLSILLNITLTACDDKNENENDKYEFEFIDSRIANIIGFVLSDGKPDDYTCSFHFEKQNSPYSNTSELYGDGFIGLINLFDIEGANTDIIISIYDTAEHATKSLDKYSDFQASSIISTKNELVVIESNTGLFDSFQSYGIKQGTISDKRLNFIKGALEDESLKTAYVVAGTFTKDFFNVQAFYDDYSQIVYRYESVDNEVSIDDYSNEISQIGIKYTSDSFVKQEEETIYIYLKDAIIL